ncbi:M48 family metalloprotease [Paenibacillus sp. MBLB4367]|uniref:M48 family metalloprotease n=1 Tax=Paenibacillus sp. MBLB4367 TaxID=3384767 RepID=UPI00390803DF
MQTQTEMCPKCGLPMPVHPGYVTWCDGCRWNIDPQAAIRKESALFERLHRKLGEAASQKLLGEALNRPVRERRTTAGKAAAFCFAALLYGLVLFMAVLAIAKFTAGRTIGEWLEGSIYASAVLLLRPRIFKHKGKIADRGEYPALYKAVDAVADALHAPRVHGIVINYAYNASFALSGWRRRRLLTVGIPLFAALSTEEKLAIIAHEMGHNANKDISRGLFVGTVLYSLGRLYTAVYPKTDYSGLIGWLAPLLGWVRELLSQAILFVWFLLGITVWREMQRAEYAADYAAAAVVGRESAVSALHKMYYEPTFYSTLEKVGDYRYTKRLFEEFRNRIVTVPDREIRRITLLMESETSRLESTHPPTPHRVSFLQRQSVTEAGPALDSNDLEAFELEFERIEAQMEKRILDMYRAYREAS